MILIGEMRDLETISMAITAAETGHLVFGTLHTTSAISTVDRIIDVFPPDAQQQVRVQLSSTLQGVISQCLVPKIGGGRSAAREILVATDGVRSLIREGKTSQLLNLIQTGKSAGMCTLEAELANLVQNGQIELDQAIGKANRAEEVRRCVEHGGRSAGANGNGHSNGTATAGRSANPSARRPEPTACGAGSANAEATRAAERKKGAEPQPRALLAFDALRSQPSTLRRGSPVGSCAARSTLGFSPRSCCAVGSSVPGR